MPDWLTILLAIVGGVTSAVAGVVVALGGFGGYAAWRQFRHQAPISTQEAMHRSFERQIASAEKRGDAGEVERLGREMEGQEEAWRAQQGVISRTSQAPLTLDEPVRLAPEELDELRRLLRASQPLLAFSVQDSNIRGNAYFQVGDYQQALAAYDLAIALRPDFPEAHSNQGAALERLGRHPDALAACDRAIALWPDYPEAHYNRGVALENLRRYEEALAACDRAIALRPDYAEAHTNRGGALGCLGRHEEALAACDRAIALRPDSPQAHNNQGSALGNLERYEDALAAYDQAIALRPDYPEAHSNRGVALGRLGRYEEALAAFDCTIALRPNDATAAYNKACALSRLTRWDEALEWLGRAIVGGGIYKDLARTDPAFHLLREHPEHGPRFWALVGRQ